MYLIYIYISGACICVHQRACLPAGVLTCQALRQLRGCTRLEVVSFKGCGRLTDQAVGFLMPMQAVQYVQVQVSRCSDAGAGAALPIATHLPILPSYYYHGCRRSYNCSRSITRVADPRQHTTCQQTNTQKKPIPTQTQRCQP